MQTLLQKNVLDSLTPFPTSLPHLRSYLYRNSRNDTLHYVILHANKIKCHGNLNLKYYIQRLVYYILHHSQQIKIFKQKKSRSRQFLKGKGKQLCKSSNVQVRKEPWPSLSKKCDSTESFQRSNVIETILKMIIPMTLLRTD